MTSAPVPSGHSARSPAALLERYQKLQEPIFEELSTPPKPAASGRLVAILRTFFRPIPKERQEVNSQRWEKLPDHLRTPSQTLGRAHHSCGATYGVLERCNFACTSCYLSREANATKALGAEEVRRQLDQLRCFLGPHGKAQITAGEVTLLPRSVLGSYIRYAISIGLDPMVMTHGERFLAQPQYLEDLVSKDGLRKISIHVDSTQRGRANWHPGIAETELHSLREEYAHLIRRVRARTGRKLHAAHTVTVNHQNAHHVPSIADWVARNADAFRMVSFQPVASVGRTEDHRLPELTMETMWSAICKGLGTSLNARAMEFGHPECNIMAPVVVVSQGDKRIVLETARKGYRWDRGFLRRLLEGIGGFSTVGSSTVENLAGLSGLTLRNLPLALEAPFYALYRMWGLRSEVIQLVKGFLRGQKIQVAPLALIVHNFMSPEELDSEVGKERLSTCVFNVPVEGEMVPMCSLNGTDLRETLTRAAKLSET